MYMVIFLMERAAVDFFSFSFPNEPLVRVCSTYVVCSPVIINIVQDKYLKR